MKIKELESYLNNLDFIINKKLEIETNIEYIDEKKLYIIDEISNFIVKNKEYSYIDSFLKLSDALVKFIECYNEGIINNSNIKDYFLSLKKSLYQFENELKQQYEINIYFYGNDKYGIINDNLNIMPIKKIASEKYLKTIALKNNRNSKKRTYNILFLSEDILFKNNFFDEILNYNKIALAIKNASEILYKNNYDLNFMKCSLNKAINDSSVETIIVGNSYPLVGIDRELFSENAVNLSMSSQDLYYSFELAKKTILSNKNINKCILGISYYLLRHDLSMGESEYSKNMIKRVYYPLLGDVHNFKELDINKADSLYSFSVDILIKSIFDLNKVEDYYINQIYNKNTNYYNEYYNPRNDNFRWYYLNQEQKETIGYNRANQHNKLLKYENTKDEYLQILNNFINFAKINNIELIFVVFPTTSYYSDSIKSEFKDEFENIIFKIKNEDIKIIDLRVEDNGFDDMDFADSDHLNNIGATKATVYIKSQLL